MIVAVIGFVALLGAFLCGLFLNSALTNFVSMSRKSKNEILQARVIDFYKKDLPGRGSGVVFISRLEIDGLFENGVVLSEKPSVDTEIDVFKDQWGRYVPYKDYSVIGAIIFIFLGIFILSVFTVIPCLMIFSQHLDIFG